MYQDQIGQQKVGFRRCLRIDPFKQHRKPAVCSAKDGFCDLGKLNLDSSNGATWWENQDSDVD